MTEQSGSDDIVISGISCRLPESDNVDEFWDNLISGRDMVTEDDRRWPPGINGFPNRNGKLKDLSKFDALFFGIPPKQVNTMDPAMRMLLEVTYEAIVDSGEDPATLRGHRVGVFVGSSHSESHHLLTSDPANITGYEMIGCNRSMLANRISYFFDFTGEDPATLRGHRVGVFVGSSHSESHHLLTSDPANITGYEMIGCNRSMLANRISYFFDFTGPSYSVDTACSSGLEGLCNAVWAIREGRCDAAIVGTVNLVLRPETSLQFQALRMLSSDGSCKSFDESANGYCRSEGIVVIYIQRRPDCKRTYLQVVDILDNCDGFKEQGITYPSGEMQNALLQEVYSKAAVDPSHVTYVEAHGTGTAVGDPEEVNTIADVFCKFRKDPLLLGSIKSNMGHSESTAGLAGIAKVLLSMKHSKIPRNLHFETPNPNIPGLLDGRIEVVTKTTDWKPGLSAINSFGFGGANVHAILSPCRPERTAKKDNTTRVVVASARTEMAAEQVITALQESPTDLEFHCLINETLRQPPKTHPFRCLTLLNSKTQSSQIKKCEDIRPVWFIFPGMGCQWSGMGRDMLAMSVFQTAIDRCQAALDPLGFNLKQLLAECTDKELAEDPMKASIGICSIQIALVDILRAVGVTPSGIIGHSVGELASAYADNALTLEQTILAAYWRARSIKEANLPPGAMAAVGLTWEEANMVCPTGIVAACHNAKDSVTISGPKDLVEQFVAELQADGKFARMVNSSGIAFHSPCMRRCVPALLDALKDIIPDAVCRSPRWLSSSIPESKWATALAQRASAEYNVNNVVSPVLFHQAILHIPPNATVIEIGPHGLLQGILRRSCGPDVTLLSLMKKQEEDNVSFCLTNIGRCYLSGVDVNPMVLCPMVSFPVARDTPMLSPLVGWDHEHTWDVPKPNSSMDGSCGQRVIIDLDKDVYLHDHSLNTSALYPAGGFVAMAWQSFAKAHGKQVTDTPITMFDFRMHNASILPETGKLEYTVRISKVTGNVEILEKDVLLATCRIQIGCLHSQDVVNRHPDVVNRHPDIVQNETMFTEDIYKEMQIRGCDFGPHFQSLIKMHISGRSGSVQWQDNILLYLDSLFQACALLDNERQVRLPTSVNKIEIDPTYIPYGKIEAELDYEYDDDTDVTQAPGIVMTGVSFTSTQRKLPHGRPITEEYCFVPHNETMAPVPDNVTQYYDACLNLASLISNGSVASTESSLDGDTDYNITKDLLDKRGLSVVDNFEAKNPKHTILKYLSSLPKLDQHDNGLRNKCDEDILSIHCVNAVQLKTTLDMAVENLGVPRVRVLYCTTSDLFTASVVSQLKGQFQEYPHISFELILSSPVKYVSEQLKDQQKSSMVVSWMEAVELAIKDSVHLVVLSIGCGCDISNDVMQQLLHLTSKLSENTLCIIHKCELKELLVKVINNGETSVAPYIAIDDILQHSRLLSLADKSDGFLSRLVLCRRKKKLPKYEVVFVDNNEFTWIEDAQLLLRENQKKKDSVVWFVAKGQGFSGIVGFVKCLRPESLGKHIRCIYRSEQEIDKRFLPGGDDFTMLAEKDLVMNIYQDGVWGSFRKKTIVEDGLIQSCNSVYLDQLHHGDLTSLQWVEMPSVTLPDRHERLYVHFASLNFRDMMLATGRLNSDILVKTAGGPIHLGLEASGVNDNGKRKMAIVASQGLATEWTVPSQYTWDVPENWSLREAASVPVAYSTAYYALVLRAGLKTGDTILIHSATSSVGQAALRIARSLDCTIYATVGTVEKVEFLQKHYGLPRTRIANSRNTEFLHQFSTATKGKGMDVVLNSLSEEKLQISLDLVACNGHFLEIGKYDLSRNSKLGMAVFLRNITFHGIVLEYWLQPGHREWDVVRKLVERGIGDGVVVPLQTYVYDMDNAERAFRFMGEGKHVGKVLIQMRSEEPSKKINKFPLNLVSPVKCRPKLLSVPGLRRTYFDDKKTYIITGGLGGLGLELANWMVKRGAMKLILTSRSGVKYGYQKKMLDLMKKRGVRVIVSQRNVVYLKEAIQLITEGEVLGSIGGVFHLAAVLHDAFFESQTTQTFHEVVDVKVQGCLNLDDVTRRKCSASLDWFVVFSSAAVCYGNAGQSNYGMGNSAMERICEKRRRDGLHGKALQWGFIGDVGIVQRNLGGNKWFNMGSVPQRIQSFLEVLDHFLQRPEAVLSCVVAESKQTSNAETFDTSSRQDEIVHAVLRIIGMKDTTEIGADVPLSDLGLDSLMITEIRQVLGRRFNIQTNVADIYQMTINSLKAIHS